MIRRGVHHSEKGNIRSKWTHVKFYVNTYEPKSTYKKGSTFETKKNYNPDNSKQVSFKSLNVGLLSHN